MTEVKKTKKNIPAVCVLIILLSLLVRQLVVGYMDNDFYHIAVSGRHIVTEGLFYENPYFVESGYHMIVQQWLYAVLLYRFYEWAGFTGVFLFTALQAFLLLGITWKYLKLRSCDTQVARIGAVLMVLSIQELCCRPEIISICLLVLQLYLLELYRIRGVKAALYLLPLLTLAEINLHASYGLFHLILLLPYIVPMHKIPMIDEMEKMTGIKEDTVLVKTLILPVILMLLSFLLNPYGPESLIMVAKSGNIRLLNITELKPVSIMEAQSAFLLFGIVLIGITIGLKRLKQSSFMMGLGILLITLISIKNALFWSIVLLAVYADLLEQQDCHFFWDLLEIKNKTLQVVLPILSVVAGVLLMMIQGGIRLEKTAEGTVRTRSGIEVQETDSELHPIRAVEYILSHEADPGAVRMMNSFNNGSYFLWNGIGHVYIEPKTEPYLRSINGRYDIVSEYAYQILKAPTKDIASFVERYDFDYICCSSYMQGLQVYLDLTDTYECVLDSDEKDPSYIKELGVEIPYYRLYRKK